MLYKFTAVNDKAEPIYINLQAIIAIEPNGEQYDSVNQKEIPCTKIMVGQGHPIYVREHITEIVAIIEGRDPTPAKILFGKGNK